jgi:hypothetical protein
MKLCLTLIASILTSSLASSAYAVEPPEVHRYSNVQYIPEAGDLVGLSLEILAGPSLKVRYELCEGWCNGAHLIPAEIRGETICFTVREDLMDQNGRPVPPHVYRVEAKVVRTPFGRRLVVTSPDDREFYEVLSPVARGP